MPIDFGTETGRVVPGVGVLLSGDAETLLRRQRQAQLAKAARPRQRGTMAESERLRVYIYNVGPFSRRIDTLGSEGIHFIPGLPEDQVDGLHVAGPDIIPGLPAESWPSEPRGIWLECDPDEHLKWTDADGEVFTLKDRPGIDLALRIIGGHEQSPRPIYSASPYQRGCFVSTVPEQFEPVEPKEPDGRAGRAVMREYDRAMADYEEAARMWRKWMASRSAAWARFTEWAMRRGEEQSLAYSNGKYERDEELYVLARIFDKTERDWNFLAGTSTEITPKVKCWSCGRAVEVGMPKCQCGELQISRAEYEARRKAVEQPEAA